MKRIIGISILSFIFINSVHADQVKNIAGNCDTSYHFSNGDNPFVTMYGDSLGDYVDRNTHGIFGWNSYLGSARPDINWDVQNLAIETWTTMSVWKAIVNCANQPLKNAAGDIQYDPAYPASTVPRPVLYERTVFKTSNHATFEIGGNDVMNVVVSLIIFPWKVYSYTDPLTGLEVKGVIDQVLWNTKAIIRLLRHPMIDKDVLVIGNFPSLAYSPSLGNVTEYYSPFMDFNNRYSDEYYKKSMNQTQDQLTILVQELFLVFTGVGNGLVAIYFAVTGQNLIADVVSPPKEMPMALKQYSNTAQSWYVNWVTTMWKNPTTVLSMTLGLSQGGLEQTVNDENSITQNRNGRKNPNVVSFLPMYAEFIYWPDCNNHGQCWVGNPLYFRDYAPGHVNTLGYHLWASRMSNKIAELGWDKDTDLRMGGLVNGGISSGAMIPEIIPEPVTADPSPIDWVLLFCLLTGKCW